MSKLYIWKCTVDLSSHTEEELEYYPNYEHDVLCYSHNAA